MSVIRLEATTYKSPMTMSHKSGSGLRPSRPLLLCGYKVADASMMACSLIRGNLLQLPISSDSLTALAGKLEPDCHLLGQSFDAYVSLPYMYRSELAFQLIRVKRASVSIIRSFGAESPETGL